VTGVADAGHIRMEVIAEGLHMMYRAAELAPCHESKGKKASASGLAITHSFLVLVGAKTFDDQVSKGGPAGPKCCRHC
jgi:hypothetical protein